MRILAISGSLRASSTNTTLVRAIMRLAPENMLFSLYDELGELPHFSPDIDIEDAPQPVNALRRQLRDADGVLLCTPEYAYGVPGSLKNALDWTVSSGEFVSKPVVVISASPSILGGDKAHASLLLTLTALSANIVEGGTLIIPLMRTKLNANGEITDTATTQALRSVLAALAQTITSIV